MKALCPHCGGRGCTECDGGYYEVSMAEGVLWLETCTKCGRELGGRVDPKRLASRSCLDCGAPTQWECLG